MRATTDERLTYSWPDGLIGGIIGAMLMGMVSMVLFPLLGIGGFWQPMNLIGALFNQSWGGIPGFAVAPSLLGMVVHMMMSAVLGILFAWTATHVGGNPVVNAVIAGLIVWVVAHFALLPLIDPVMARTFPYWLFGLVHVMYGIGLGGYLTWRGSRAGEATLSAAGERTRSA